MNKKIISLLVALSLTASLAFAATTITNSVTALAAAGNVNSNDKTVYLVSQVAQQDLVGKLEAETTSGVFTSVTDDYYLQNTDWDISAADITQLFKVSTKGRLFNSTDVNLLIKATKFKRLDESNAIDSTATAYTIDKGVSFAQTTEGTTGTLYSALTAATPSNTVAGDSNNFASLTKPFTISNNYAAADFVELFQFSITYEKDNAAPAGNYRSDITLEYTTTT